MNMYGDSVALRAAETAPGRTETHTMDAIRSSRVNDGVLHEYGFAWKKTSFNKKPPQNMVVWIPDGVKILRGVMVYTNDGTGARRTDLQAFARSVDFALAGTAIRYREMGRVLSEQLAWVGERTGHRELAHVPWILHGFSRMEAAALNFVALRCPERTLCVISGGGPGTALALSEDDPTVPSLTADHVSPLSRQERLALAAGIPLMKVAASQDAVLHGKEVEEDHLANHANWMRDCYVKWRALDLPWGVALEWDVGHTTRNSGAVFRPFIQAVLKARYPADADPAAGPVTLRPLRVQDGLLVDAGNWLDRYGESMPYARYDGPAETAVWLPDMNTYTAWRSLSSRDTTARVAAAVGPDGKLVLALTGLPDNTEGMEWFAYAQPLGTGPEVTTTVHQGREAKTIYAVIAAGGKKLWTQPIQVMGGRLVVQAASAAPADAEETQ
jgi:hypothetical protein